MSAINKILTITCVFFLLIIKPSFAQTKSVIKLETKAITTATPFFPFGDLKTKFIGPNDKLTINISAATIDNTAKVEISKIDGLPGASLENIYSHGGYACANIVWKAPAEENVFYCTITATSIKDNKIESTSKEIIVYVMKNIINQSPDITSAINYPLLASIGEEFNYIISAERNIIPNNHEILKIAAWGLEGIKLENYNHTINLLETNLKISAVVETKGIYLLEMEIFDEEVAPASTYLQIPVIVD